MTVVIERGLSGRLLDMGGWQRQLLWLVIIAAALLAIDLLHPADPLPFLLVLVVAGAYVLDRIRSHRADR